MLRLLTQATCIADDVAWQNVDDDATSYTSTPEQFKVARLAA